MRGRLPAVSAAAVMHTVVLLALVISYTVLTALGHDASNELELLGAYAVGAGVQKAGSR